MPRSSKTTSAISSHTETSSDRLKPIQRMRNIVSVNMLASVAGIALLTLSCAGFPTAQPVGALPTVPADCWDLGYQWTIGAEGPGFCSVSPR